MNTRKLIAEFIGTFFLILTYVVAIKSGKVTGFEPLALGFLLIVMTYANRAISGAHFNPVVSLAAFFRGHMTVNELVAYVSTQIVAAVFAAFSAGALLQGLETENGNLPLRLDLVPAFLAEFFGTFTLVYVILNVTMSRRTGMNSYFGTAIGLTLACVMFTLGPISGGAFNPAVVIGAGIAEIIEWSTCWIHLVGEILATILAATAFRFLEHDVEDLSL